MKIFISIASYCDELLVHTVRDCVKKANEPNNLVFGVVDQGDTSVKDELLKILNKEQLRYVFIDKVDTLGVCWARNIAFSLYHNEKYLLQIDSHMLFENHWDEVLISQHNNLLRLSDKPIISVYPYNFTIVSEGVYEHKTPSNKEMTMLLRPTKDSKLTNTNSVLRFHATHIDTPNPLSGCHIAAGFLFTYGNFINEVPYDPFLYFHGEEQSLSVRAYTRGWDIFHPNIIPLYHMYKKIEDGKELENHHWHSSVKNKRALDFGVLHKRSIERLNRLLYGDGLVGTSYGLGSVRTLDEYIEFSGIDYKNKIIK